MDTRDHRNSQDVSFKKGVQGASFNAIGNYSRLAIRVVTSILLARLLPPTYFGIVGLAVSYSNLLNRVNTFKINEALIQRDIESDRDKAVHFSLSLILGSVPFCGGLLIFFVFHGVKDPLLLVIILFLSLAPFFQNLGSTPKTLLQKNLQFKHIAIPRIIAAVTSSVISILLAKYGLGIWSLVSYHVLERIIKTPLFWMFSSWTPTIHLSKDLLKYYLVFGGVLFIGRQFEFLFNNLNNFVIGTYVSYLALAYYTRAYSLTKYVHFVSLPIINTAQPMYAKAKENKRVLSKTYNLTLSTITHVSWPLSFTLFLFAPTFVEFLIGEKWLPVIPILRIFIFSSLALPLITASTKLLNMTGNPKKTMKIKVIQGLLIFISLPLLLLFGIEGAAYGLSITTIITVLFLFFRYLPDSIDLVYKKVFFPPFLSILFSLGTFFVLQNNMILSFSLPVSHSISLLLTLFFKASIFLTIYFSFLLMLERKRLIVIVRRIFQKLL